MWGCVYDMVHVWRSEDSLQELILLPPPHWCLGGNSGHQAKSQEAIHPSFGESVYNLYPSVLDMRQHRLDNLKPCFLL